MRANLARYSLVGADDLLPVSDRVSEEIERRTRHAIPHLDSRNLVSFAIRDLVNGRPAHHHDPSRQARCDRSRDPGLHELYFIKHMLECMDRGGTGIAIVPMSCAIAPHKARAELLRDHTIEAVMSLPDELFYPVGTIACAMVFTAKIPHAVSNKKSWFGYWKNDGFSKTKHKGRVDQDNTWPRIRDNWVTAFRNREVRAGESVSRHVTEDDEWCAEAYMETDYSKLTQADFEKVLKDYAVYRLLGGGLGEEQSDGGENADSQ